MARGRYADLTLPGKEAEFFALYEITDRGSSWLGPLVAGAILQSAAEDYTNLSSSLSRRPLVLCLSSHTFPW